MTYIVSVTIHVQPEQRTAFIHASHDNADNTRLEPGCLQFDVAQANDDPNCFHLYEAYRTPADFTAHQQTAHYLRWRDAVNPWMAKNRVGVKWTRISPA